MPFDFKKILFIVNCHGGIEFGGRERERV